MKKILLLIIFILSFFYPWISLTIIALVVLYLTWTYYSTSSYTQNFISEYKSDIVSYFEEKLGNSKLHYDYISKNSLYFIYASSSKTFSAILRQILILIFLINIVYFFRFDKLNIIYFIASLLIGILAYYISMNFTKPISDYQSRKVSKNISPSLSEGLEEYPKFFYHGEWKKIKDEKKLQRIQK